MVFLLFLLVFFTLGLMIRYLIDLLESLAAQQHQNMVVEELSKPPDAAKAEPSLNLLGILSNHLKTLQNS